VTVANSKGLSRFQVELANLFFSLPESVGFLLAGGGALIAQGLIQRETDDLDFFGSRKAGDVATAGDALVAASTRLGWVVETVRAGDEYRRIKIVRAGEEVYIDLAIDSPPIKAPTVTIIGPSFTGFELAVHKTLALFGRAEPRDFSDLHALHQHIDRGEILTAAMQADTGFDLGVFTQMLRSHRRLADEDFPSAPSVSELRTYFDAWADNLGGPPT